MAFIGNTVQNQGFTPAIDYFNGNGVTVTFTLSRPIASVAQVIVAVDNVIQNPSSAFGVVGNSITFTSAPLAGTNNIWVEYTSLITTYQGISQDPTVIGDIRATGGYLAEGDFGNSFVDGNLIDYVTGRGRFTVGELDDIVFYHGGTGARSEMMDLYYAGGAKIYGTTALTIPVGTTGQRPTGATGMLRMNTTTGYPEWYDTSSSSWVQFNKGVPYSINYLVVAGGGSGGGEVGGGGGAGGLLSGTSTVTSDVSYTVIVGAGGTGTTAQGNNGGDSAFSAITAIGGGGGGTSSGGLTARNGGSGGGSGGFGTAIGTGTAGQGNNGGPSVGIGAPNYPGAGGGGKNGVGGTPPNGTTPGAGGTGFPSSISGSSVTYATGGVGGLYNSGGNINGVSAAANTGNGGGGAYAVSNGPIGGAGGSGIVIISYAGAQRGTGGTVTSSGGNTIHTFTTSGTFTYTA